MPYEYTKIHIIIHPNHQNIRISTNMFLTKFYLSFVFSIKWSFELELKGLSQENFVNKQELCVCCNGFVVLGDIYASSLHLIRNMGIFPYNNARDHHMHANN